MKKNYTSTFLFLFLLISISFFYKYNEIAFKRPQSIHKWRQSDCASIALNYYQDGMIFFNPETHNLTSDSGKSGKSCTSEVPILYYSVAILYKFLGYHECIFRILNTLLFFLGLFFLFRLLRYLLKDVFWAITLSLLFFTSPVLVYYGNNYLSNSSALAFSIISWYYFILFVFEKRKKCFYISMLFFLIAAAFKVTAFFSLFAITAIYLFEIKKLFGTEKLFIKPIHFLLTVASVFFIIGLWLIYAHVSNQKHDCFYFSTTTFPIWKLNSDGIKDVINNIKYMWLNQYFHKSVLFLLLICFFSILIFFRKNKKLFIYGVIFILFEEIIYVILQFSTFKDHDYYVIDMYILPILIIVSTFDLLKNNFNKLFNSYILKVAFSLFLLFNIYYAQKKIDERYESGMNDYSLNRDIYSITPYLRQIGISPNDTIISIPDYSNASLYLMNQKGWTEYTDEKFGIEPKVKYNRDSAGIQRSIKNGAKYLIVNGITELYEKPYLQNYCTNLAGKYNNVLIFNLKNNKRNYNLEKRTIEKIVHCNAEILCNDKKSFLGDIDSIKFQSGETQSDKFAHSGKYSSKLDANSPYGMTINFNDLKNGESFLISVWRKASGKSKGFIIASCSPSFYNNEVKTIETDSNGWEKVSMEFFVPLELANKVMTIYVYNPNSEPVYFDDLEIIRFKSFIN